MRDKKRTMILAAGVGILLFICCLVFMGVQKKSNNRVTEPNSSTQITAVESLESFSDENTGILAVKNACGQYSDQVYTWITKRDYKSLLQQVNMEALRKYGYTLDEGALENYYSNLNDLLPADSRMMVVDLMKSSLTPGAFNIFYCIEGKMTDLIDSESYDYNGSLWGAMTVYFEDGAISSFLPCQEASIDSYAQTMGFKKGGMK